MAGLSITSATAVYMLSVTNVFPAPQQLQGFAADDIFDTEPLESAEVSMGVDGQFSAGFIFVPVKQSISLQANSDSNDIFDAWWQASQLARDIFRAQATLSLKSVGKKWTMTDGVLTSYMPIPAGGKVLKPRKFGITWGSVSPSAV